MVEKFPLRDVVFIHSRETRICNEVVVRSKSNIKSVWSGEELDIVTFRVT